MHNFLNLIYQNVQIYPSTALIAPLLENPPIEESTGASMNDHNESEMETDTSNHHQENMKENSEASFQDVSQPLYSTDYDDTGMYCMCHCSIKTRHIK